MKKLTAMLFSALFSLAILVPGASACPDGEDKPGVASLQPTPALACPGDDDKPQA